MRRNPLELLSKETWDPRISDSRMMNNFFVYDAAVFAAEGGGEVLVRASHRYSEFISDIVLGLALAAKARGFPVMRVMVSGGTDDTVIGVQHPETKREAWVGLSSDSAMFRYDPNFVAGDTLHTMTGNYSSQQVIASGSR